MPPHGELYAEIMAGYHEGADQVSGWRAMVVRCGALIDELGSLPPALQPTVDALRRGWESGQPSLQSLEEARVAMWHFLHAKNNGSSTTIADLTDRSIRAALITTEPVQEPGIASECAGWPAEMLATVPPWPRPTVVF